MTRIDCAYQQLRAQLFDGPRRESSSPTGFTTVHERSRRMPDKRSDEHAVPGAKHVRLVRAMPPNQQSRRR